MSVLLRLCCSLVVLIPSLAHAQLTSSLEIPGNGVTLSGVGVISGWKCEAGDITIRLNDGDPIPATYGLPRADTSGVCGNDGNNGFFSYTNWANLGDGEHTAVAYDNGVEFARSTFEVTTLGTPFLQGASREVTVFDFPEVGTDVVLKWVQALQNFVITDRVVSPSDALFGSRFCWAATPFETEPGVTDTVYWARTDGSATGSISAAVDSRLIVGERITDFAIDSVEDKLYLLTSTPRSHEGGDGGAIHRVNLDGTEYEEVWVYETSSQYGVVGVQEISVGRGDIYLTIRGSNIHYDVRNLRRLSIADVLSNTADGPPRTGLYLPGSSSSPSPDVRGYDVEKVYDASQLTSLFDGYGLPTDIHVIGDTMYFIANGSVYRARTNGSGVRTEYSPPANSAVVSLEVRDGTLWWLSREGQYSFSIYRRSMGAAPGSEELVYENAGTAGPIVVSPIDQTIYFPVGSALHRYQQGAESSEVHITTSVEANILELVP